MDKNITMEQLEAYEKAFDSDLAKQVAMRAVTNCGVVKAATNNEIFRQDRHQFSISLEQGKITNQKQSGRCWMFAALNTMRFAVMQKLNLATFELSQNYTLFYDKLEKANYFLESILETYVGHPVELIPCGGGDRIAAEREQWNDGSNTLCIAPGTIVVYERNDVTNALLKEKGLKVLEMPSAELSRGRGGPRCMSMPLVRED